MIMRILSYNILDYTFANIPIKDYRLLEWDAEVSDHVAQYFEI